MKISKNSSFSWLDSCFDAVVDRVENIWGMLKSNNNMFAAASLAASDRSQ